MVRLVLLCLVVAVVAVVPLVTGYLLLRSARRRADEWEPEPWTAAEDEDEDEPPFWIEGPQAGPAEPYEPDEPSVSDEPQQGYDVLQRPAPEWPGGQTGYDAPSGHDDQHGYGGAGGPGAPRGIGVPTSGAGQGSAPSRRRSSGEPLGGETTEEDLDIPDWMQAEQFRTATTGTWPVRSRYLTADLPARIPVGDVANLIASIRLDPGQGAQVAALKSLDVPREGIRLNIVTQPSPGLVPLDRLDRELLLRPDGDSEPVRFPFEARVAGLHRVAVTVWAGGTFAGELTVEVSAEARAPVTPGMAHWALLDRLAPIPGEATLQVRRSSGGYMFQLMTPHNLYPPVTESLAGDPGDTVERTIATLQGLAAGHGGYSGSAASLWLREAGVSLWNEMVPQVIKEQFWEQRSRITSFNIATDQDIVPWELLYPLSPAQDEGFLVEQFPVMRRVYGQQRATAISLHPAAFVLARDAPVEAYDEVTAINRRMRAVPGTNNGTLVNDVESLLEVINRGSPGLLHFACHNRFDVTGGGSAVTMADGDFTPMMLTSAATGRTLATGPLVFLNACRSAGAAYQYTRLMGWASGFMAAGAGAFVGTLWAVPSGPAREFAEAFYDACLVGSPLGEAVHAARTAIRRPGDPTWLAYTVYGDPAARVRG